MLVRPTDASIWQVIRTALLLDPITPELLESFQARAATENQRLAEALRAREEAQSRLFSELGEQAKVPLPQASALLQASAARMQAHERGVHEAEAQAAEADEAAALLEKAHRLQEAAARQQVAVQQQYQRLAEAKEAYRQARAYLSDALSLLPMSS